MASKVLSQEDLDKLMSDVNSMDKAKLEVLAKEFAEKMEQDKEKRKKYHQNKTPEQVEKQRAYMKKRSAEQRERMKLIIARAQEMGITIPGLKGNGN